MQILWNHRRLFFELWIAKQKKKFSLFSNCKAVLKILQTLGRFSCFHFAMIFLPPPAFRCFRFPWWSWRVKLTKKRKKLPAFRRRIFIFLFIIAFRRGNVMGSRKSKKGGKWHRWRQHDNYVRSLSQSSHPFSFPFRSRKTFLHNNFSDHIQET